MEQLYDLVQSLEVALQEEGSELQKIDENGDVFSQPQAQDIALQNSYHLYHFEPATGIS